MNMSSAANAQGLFPLTLIEGRETRGVFAEFPERLLRGMDRKVFLLVDGHPTHKARSVQRFVEAHAERMELPFSCRPMGRSSIRTSCRGRT